MIGRLLYEAVRMGAAIFLARWLDPLLGSLFNPDIAEVVFQIASVLVAAVLVIVVSDRGLSRPVLRLAWWDVGARTEISGEEVKIPCGAGARPIKWTIFLEHTQPSVFAWLVTRRLRTRGEAALWLGLSDTAAATWTRESSGAGTGVKKKQRGITFPVYMRLPHEPVTSISDTPAQLSWAVLALEAQGDPGLLRLRIRTKVRLETGAGLLARLALFLTRIDSGVKRVTVERRP